MNGLFCLIISSEFTLLSRWKNEQKMMKITKNNEKHNKNQLKHKKIGEINYKSVIFF